MWRFAIKRDDLPFGSSLPSPLVSDGWASVLRRAGGGWRSDSY